MLYRRCSVVWMEMIGRPDGMAYGMDAIDGCGGVERWRMRRMMDDGCDGLVDLEMSRVSRRSVHAAVMVKEPWRAVT